MEENNKIDNKIDFDADLMLEELLEDDEQFTALTMMVDKPC